MEKLIEQDKATILTFFFEYLEQEGIDYCVVGRTDELPDKISGDIDLVMCADGLKHIHQHMFEFCRQNNLKLVQVLEHEPSAYYFVLSWMDLAGKPQYLHPDICGDYIRGSRLFLTAGEILTSRRPALDKSGIEKGFYVPSVCKEFIYYLLKKIDKQALDAGQGEHLSEMWAQDPDGCFAEIQRFWSKDKAEMIFRAAAERNWESISKNISSFQKSLESGLPAISMKARINEMIRKWYRILSPTGFHIVFLGPDGSGKSSVIERAIPCLAPAFRRTSSSHLRPHFGRKITNRSPVTNPHSQAPRSLIASVAKVFYFWCDYFFGWWLTIWVNLVSSTFVVYDRYYYDLLVDPRRYRYSGPMSLARWIGQWIPQPDLILLLDAPPEVLRSRKQEVSFEETGRQRKAYLKLVRNMKNGIIIDASQPLEKVIVDVNEAVLGALAHRTEKRHG